MTWERRHPCLLLPGNRHSLSCTTQEGPWVISPDLRNKSLRYVSAYAGHAVARTNFYQRRPGQFALIDCYRTTRVKAAPFGRVDGTGYVTFEAHLPAFSTGHRHRYRRQKSLRVRMERSRKYLFGIGFLDYLAKIHDSDAIGYVFDYRKVVRDEQIREAELLLKVAEQVQYLSLNRNVES